MRKMKRTISAAMAGMMLFAGAAFADEKADRIAEIKEQIAQLESELAELEGEEKDEAEFSAEIGGVTYTYLKNELYTTQDGQELLLVYFDMQNESGETKSPFYLGVTAFQNGVSIPQTSIYAPEMEYWRNESKQVQSGYSLTFFQAFVIDGYNDITLNLFDPFGSDKAEFTFSISK